MDSTINPNESNYYDINSDKNQNDPFKINRQKGNFFRCVFSTFSLIILIIILIKLIKNSSKLKTATKKYENNIVQFNAIESEIVNYKNKSEFAANFRKIVDEINSEIKKNQNDLNQIKRDFNYDKNSIDSKNSSNKILEEEIENLKNQIKNFDEEISKLKIEKENLEKEINEISN